ncbi:MAG: hypothetical protein ABIS47_08505 [Acidimicrobiales bacterium]
MARIVLIKTLLLTVVQVSELVRIRLVEVDLDACRMCITQGKGARNRTVPGHPGPPARRSPDHAGTRLG